MTFSQNPLDKSWARPHIGVVKSTATAARKEVNMPVQFETFEASERKTKGGGVRPAYKYDGVKRDSVRSESADSLLADLLEVSGGNLGKIADFVVEGFNSLAEKAANPLKDETVKAVIAAMKSVGQKVDIARAREIADQFKAKGQVS